MRRHLSLTLTALFVVASGTTLGVATATTANAAPLAGPHTSVTISSTCKPASLYCFKRAAKTIVSGTKVIWKNPTFAPHTITRCTAAACSGVDGGSGTDADLGSPTVGSGGTYKFVFHGAGTYNYYCTIHGYGVMHGTITVTP